MGERASSKRKAERELGFRRELVSHQIPGIISYTHTHAHTETVSPPCVCWSLSSHMAGRDDLMVPQCERPALEASSLLEPITPNPGSDHLKSTACANCDQGKGHTCGCREPGAVLRKRPRQTPSNVLHSLLLRHQRHKTFSSVTAYLRERNSTTVNVPISETPGFKKMKM